MPGSRRWPLLCAGFLAVLTAWSLATPLLAAPDEPAHLIRAAAAGRGQLVGVSTPAGPAFDIPTSLARLVRPVSCYEHRRQNTGDCHRSVVDLPDDKSRASSPAGHYDPFYYLLVGWPMALWPDVGGVFLSRAVSGLLCALLLGTGVALLPRVAHRVVAVAALTPTALFLCATINPSALEISAVFLVWAGAVAAATAPSPPRAAVHALGLGAVLAAPTRPLGILWVAVAVLSVAAVSDRDRVRRLASHRPLWVYAGLTILGALHQWWWTTRPLVRGIVTAPEPAAAGDVVRGLELNTQAQRVREMIGTVGWNDLVAPSATYGVWLILFVLAVVLAVQARAWRATALVLAACTSFVVVSLWLDLNLPSGMVFFWQGRYNLPVAVGLPLLLVAGMSALPAWLQRHRAAFLAVLGSLLVAGHAAAFLAAQDAYRDAGGDRFRVATHVFTTVADPVAVALFVVGVVVLLLAVGARGATTRHAPAGQRSPGEAVPDSSESSVRADASQVHRSATQARPDAPNADLSPASPSRPASAAATGSGRDARHT